MASFILNTILKKFSLPSMIAPLIVGILLSLTIWFSAAYIDNYETNIRKEYDIAPDENVDCASLATETITEKCTVFLENTKTNFELLKFTIESFAVSGIIVMMFLIGFEIDMSYVKTMSKKSSIIAICSGIIPFFIGFFPMLFFTSFINYSTSIYIPNIGGFLTSILTGLVFAVTSEEISISILEELNIYKKRLGQMIIEVGVIGDIFEIFSISFVAFLIVAVSNITDRMPFDMSSLQDLFPIFITNVFLFFVGVLFVRYFLIEYLLSLIGDKKSRYHLFIISIFIMMVLTVLSHLLNLGFIIGGIFAGIVLKDKMLKSKMFKEEHSINESLNLLAFGLFEPFIFVFIGLHIDYNLLSDPIMLLLCVIVTVLAIVGKLFGSLIGRFLYSSKDFFSTKAVKESLLIGWSLNSRGIIGLFVVILAYDNGNGIITQGLFNVLAFMVISTTLLSPIIFKSMLNRHIKANGTK